MAGTGGVGGGGEAMITTSSLPSPTPWFFIDPLGKRGGEKVDALNERGKEEGRYSLLQTSLVIFENAKDLL